MVMSPFGLSLTLAALRSGAEGNTSAQLSRASHLGSTVGRDAVVRAYRDIQQGLTEVRHPSKSMLNEYTILNGCTHFRKCPWFLLPLQEMLNPEFIS